MIETHCHLDYLKEAPLDDILNEARQSGVEKIITISVDPNNLNSILELTQKYTQVYTTQGIHPHEAKLANENVYQQIKNNCQHNSKVVAIGEIGLDYHYMNSPKDIQKKVFAEQLELSIELNLPVVIHTREADEDTMEVMKPYLSQLKRKGVFHSFTSGKKLAEFGLENDFYIGFNGIITFKNAQNVRDIVEITPLNRILTETDAPFLAPVPHRGKENAPSYIKYVLEKLAELKKITVSEMNLVTSKNAQLLFKF